MGRAITVAILAAALALAAPLSAHAAGLGRLTVFSPLGQPLNAEIEIVALRPGEEEGLVARLAPLDAFTAAGIEPSGAIAGMRFTVERRDGRRVLRLTTPQPINEPFVEMLVELQWSTGRLVREYTFLLDPPEYKSPQTIAAMQPPAAPAKPAAEEAKPPPLVEARPLEPAAAPPVISPAPDRPAETAPTPRPTPAAPAPAPSADATTPPPAVTAAPIAPAPSATPAAPAPATPVANTYEVQKGDTLGAIAKQHLPPGVTLNQMLIAIYRANQDAFIRENINLVRSGRILNIPAAEDIGGVDPAEANRVVRAHMAEFRDYRSKLAAVPAAAEAAPGQREAAGRIEPKPEAAAKPPAAGDQVRLSKADPQKPGASQAARGDDQAARERALKEAQSRVGALEKNVADLQKLLELKNRQLAELEKKAGAKPAAPAAPAPAAKAPEAPKPAAPAPVAKAPEAPKPAAPAPAAPAPAEAPKPAAEAPKPAAEAPKPAAKPAAPPPPPETSVLDEILGNTTYLGALAAIVALLVGYFFYAWRKKKTAQGKFHASVMGAAAAGAAGAAAGAAGAEPGLASGPATPPAQTASGAPAGMAAEEVDPIAEADVYMAYGRDAQAEEILKEALQKDASRVAVHVKLLEIYANRKDAKSFEQGALKLKNLTNGTGPDWDKVAALGRAVDPTNSVYGTGEPAAAPAAAAAAPAAPTLDFDVGGGGQASASAPDLTLDDAPKAAADAGLDFDVSGASADKKDVSVDETVVVGKPAASMDFNLDLGSPAEPPAAPAPAAAAAPADAGLSFDLNLDLGGGDKKADAPASAAPDLSTISLDLGGSPDTTAAAPGSDAKWQEVASKLELAKAYQEMGNKDDALNLLNDVMKDGDAAQKGQAQQLIAKLG